MFDSFNLSDEVPFCYRGFSFSEYSLNFWALGSLFELYLPLEERNI